MNSTILKNALKKTLKNNVLNSSQLKFFSSFVQKPESPSISNKSLPSQTTWIRQDPKLTVKLSIPEKLLKDQNTGFVKLIIGPHGKTHKKLQKDLQCRFTIVENDGAKITKNSSGKLHFQISAPTPQNLDVAVAYLKKLIELPEHREALRNDTDKLFAEPIYTEGDSLVLSFPTDKLWVLVGTGGANIKDAMQRSGARIIVEPRNNTSLQMTDVLIKGTAEQREEAKKIVLGYCSEQMTRANGEVEYDDAMTIPKNVAKRIIGKRGEIIKNIQMKSLCRLMLIAKPGDPTVEVVKLRGSAKEISAAKAEIEEHVKKWSDNISGRLSENITIPISCISRLIGRRGQSIEEVQQLTGTVIDVQKYEAQPGESFDATKFKKVYIYGDRDGIERVKTKVQKLIDSEAASSDNQSAATNENGHNADCSAQTSSAENSTSPDSK